MTPRDPGGFADEEALERRGAMDRQKIGEAQAQAQGPYTQLQATQRLARRGQAQSTPSILDGQEANQKIHSAPPQVTRPRPTTKSASRT